jgi:hydrogenase/urease accessory protein HupE
LLATPAQAHLVETGFGAFYDGIAHLALTPADLLLVVAIALYAGQRGPRAARWTLFALPLAWLVGGAVGAGWPFAATSPLLTTASFGLLGALVAADARFAPPVIAVLAVGAGLIHGYVGGATMAPGGAEPLAVAGTVTAVFCAVASLSAEVTLLPAGWPRIAVRAVGSWVAAAGLLMVGWLARTVA